MVSVTLEIVWLSGEMGLGRKEIKIPKCLLRWQRRAKTDTTMLSEKGRHTKSSSI